VVERAGVCDDQRMATVLVVDDHARFRNAARTLLALEGFDVVGEAADGRAALAAAEALRPDVVLLDVGLPDMSGLDVAARLAEADTSTAVVLVSSRALADGGRRARRTGARGFIPKDELTGTSLREVLAR
jgi:DNA-binding NarL/FixJ family response regulator